MSKSWLDYAVDVEDTWNNVQDCQSVWTRELGK